MGLAAREPESSNTQAWPGASHVGKEGCAGSWACFLQCQGAPVCLPGGMRLLWRKEQQGESSAQSSVQLLTERVEEASVPTETGGK